MKSVLLVDDHPLFSAAVADIIVTLAPTSQVRVVDSFASAEGSLKVHGAPDLVFLDLSLPDSPASLSMSRAVGVFSPAKVVILSAYDDDARIRQAYAQGAHGFISKSLRPPEIAKAIAAVLNDRVLTDQTAAVESFSPGGLSVRQVEVMEQIIAGQTNKEIARSLGMSPGTVKVHIRNIFQRLGASTRTEAVALYRSTMAD